MELEQVRDFFLWMMVVNVVIYALTVVSVIMLRGFVVKVNRWMFGLDEDTVNRSIQAYVGNFKLLMTIFCFAPWIALVIMTWG